jgi:hypothetical protein
MLSSEELRAKARALRATANDFPTAEAALAARAIAAAYERRADEMDAAKKGGLADEPARFRSELMQTAQSAMRRAGAIGKPDPGMRDPSHDPQPRKR